MKLFNKKLTIEKCINEVCYYKDMPKSLLLAKTRKRPIVEARQIAMYFAKKYIRTTLEQIGKQIGGKDHATVIHACKTVNNLMETDKNFLFTVENIDKKICRKYKIVPAYY